MKSARIFNYSWFLFTVIASICAGELVAWTLSRYLEIRIDPFIVAIICVALSTAVGAVVTKDAELK